MSSARPVTDAKIEETAEKPVDKKQVVQPTPKPMGNQFSVNTDDLVKAAFIRNQLSQQAQLHAELRLRKQTLKHVDSPVRDVTAELKDQVTKASVVEGIELRNKDMKTYQEGAKTTRLTAGVYAALYHPKNPQAYAEAVNKRKAAEETAAYDAQLQQALAPKAPGK